MYEIFIKYQLLLDSALGACYTGGKKAKTLPDGGLLPSGGRWGTRGTKSCFSSNPLIPCPVPSANLCGFKGSASTNSPSVFMFCYLLFPVIPCLNHCSFQIQCTGLPGKETHMDINILMLS